MTANGTARYYRRDDPAAAFFFYAGGFSSVVGMIRNQRQPQQP